VCLRRSAVRLSVASNSRVREQAAFFQLRAFHSPSVFQQRAFRPAFHSPIISVEFPFVVQAYSAASRAEESPAECRSTSTQTLSLLPAMQTRSRPRRRERL